MGNMRTYRKFGMDRLGKQTARPTNTPVSADEPPWQVVRPAPSNYRVPLASSTCMQTTLCIAKALFIPSHSPNCPGSHIISLLLAWTGSSSRTDGFKVTGKFDMRQKGLQASALTSVQSV
jgi:hypothetical protein